MADVSSDPGRWRDVDKLLARPGNIVGQDFEPSPTLREDIGEIARVLVVGAGGLGCELLKDLALSGFKNIDVIDMDTIEVSNLNRQFLFRSICTPCQFTFDVGKSKAEVAAERVMKRISGVNITPHFCRIEDKDIDFYNDFNIIVLGLDSIDARSYINSVACSFLVNIIFLYICVSFVYLDQALKRAELFGITGVTYSLTQYGYNRWLMKLLNCGAYHAVRLKTFFLVCAKSIARKRVGSLKVFNGRVKKS
ncbi:hypothetical protein BHE74_00024739 [Ensete ventricosum]|nr:hypothetical protein BHE74_00024739 [Ensete ventricosum]